MIDQVPMFEALPIDNIPKPKRKVNCMNEMLAEIMTRRGIEAADIVKNTEIPWGTIMGWIYGEVGAQMADANLLKLAQYLEVSLEYLCYGIGEDTPKFEKFKNTECEE